MIYAIFTGYDKRFVTNKKDLNVQFVLYVLMCIIVLAIKKGLENKCL